MATLRAAQKEMTRKLLLDAGLDLFVAKGYTTTTIDDIASAAGDDAGDLLRVLPVQGRPHEGPHLRAAQRRARPAPSAERGSTGRDLVAVVEDGSYERIRAWLADISQQWDTIRPYTTTAFEAAAVDPDIRALLDEWLNEAINDIEEGLDRADRFPPSTRHMRGVLAMTELDHVARNWKPGTWGVDRDDMLDVLAETWHGSIGRR